MNEFKDYVSEDSVNSALKKFIQDWNSVDGTIKMKTKRYATTNDLLTNFRTIAPDSLQYVIKDLFETIKFTDDK